MNQYQKNENTLSQGNTTLTVVITNRKMSGRHLKQLGRQIHHALSEVIYPYSTILDGDVLYTITTNSVSPISSEGSAIDKDEQPDLIYLGMIGSQVAKEAVWSVINHKVQKETL